MRRSTSTRVNIPGCTAPGKVFVGQSKDPFAVNLGVIFDLLNVPGAADFTPAEAAFLLDNSKKDAGRRPRRRQRDDARDRGADELPARDRRQRSGDRWLDDGEPAPGLAAQQRAEERPPDLGARRRRLDAGLAPRHAARQRGRHRPARQGQVQQLEAEGRWPVRDLRDQPDAAGAGRDRAGDAGHRADQLPAHRPGDDLPDRHQRRQPAEGVRGDAVDRRRFRDAAPEHGDPADRRSDAEPPRPARRAARRPGAATSPAIRTGAARATTSSTSR